MFLSFQFITIWNLNSQVFLWTNDAISGGIIFEAAVLRIHGKRYKLKTDPSLFLFGIDGFLFMKKITRIKHFEESK